MRYFRPNWPLLRQTIRNDAKILINNIDGQAAINLKAVVIGVGLTLVSALALMTFSKMPSAAITKPV